jgi:chorismate mutase
VTAQGTTPADPVVASLRDEITALDVRLLTTVNARVKKVAALRRYKEEHGIAFLDPAREAWLAAYLQRVNGGPLSPDGVEELLAFVLDLTKREVAE